MRHLFEISISKYAILNKSKFFDKFGYSLLEPIIVELSLSNFCLPIFIIKVQYLISPNCRMLEVPNSGFIPLTLFGYGIWTLIHQFPNFGSFH